MAKDITPNIKCNHNIHNIFERTWIQFLLILLRNEVCKFEVSHLQSYLIFRVYAKLQHKLWFTTNNSLYTCYLHLINCNKTVNICKLIFRLYKKFSLSDDLSHGFTGCCIYLLRYHLSMIVKLFRKYGWNVKPNVIWIFWTFLCLCGSVYSPNDS